jgi:hypothetical protein
MVVGKKNMKARATWILLAFTVATSFAANASGDLIATSLARVKKDWPQRSKYEITLDVDPSARTYHGHEKVTFVNRQKRSTNYTVFFLYPNDPGLTKSQKQYISVTHIVVNGQPAKGDQNGPYLRIDLGQELQMSKAAILEFDFQATIPEQKQTADLFSEAMDELKRMMDPKSEAETDYGVFSSSKDIVNLGLWYPILSKYDPDGWDEEKYAGIGDVSFFDPADFSVSITVPTGYRVVTTGQEQSQSVKSDGSMLHVIDAPMCRDFEVELSKLFNESTRTKNGTTIRTFFLPQHSASGLSTLNTATQAFEYYSETFGSYPYTELDIVEAPLFGGAGGVEFPGLVTISSMLYGEDQQKEEEDPLQQLLSKSPVFDQMLEFVVAHEVAHQWWNAVVGSNSKKHPFIDEAMANYSAVLYFEHFHGRKAAEQQMAMQMKLNYQMHRLMGGQDKPVLLPASSFQGSLEYAAIVYGKGALFYDQLRSLIGDPAFFATWKSYYDSYWFRIAAPDSIKIIAQKKAPLKSKAIEALFQRWMNQMHGDEDIGQGTLDAVMKTVLSTNQDIPADKLDDLLKDLNDILKEN